MNEEKSRLLFEDIVISSENAHKIHKKYYKIIKVKKC